MPEDETPCLEASPWFSESKIVFKKIKVLKPISNMTKSTNQHWAEVLTLPISKKVDIILNFLPLAKVKELKWD